MDELPEDICYLIEVYIVFSLLIHHRFDTHGLIRISFWEIVRIGLFELLAKREGFLFTNNILLTIHLIPKLISVIREYWLGHFS